MNRYLIKTIPLVFGLFLLNPINAQSAPTLVEPVGPYPRLNTITYQLSMEQWVNTQAALVSITIAANVGQNTLGDLQKQITDTLQQLGKGVMWHMTQFNRSEDPSGLEQVNAVAQARIPQDQLSKIRETAKSLSKPGIKYVVSDISYDPTVADVQSVKDQLRNSMYQKIQEELQLLNKTYHQTFYVNNVIFDTSDMPPVVPAANMMRMKTMEAVVASPVPNNAAISQKITLVATITVASTVS